mmetsp:Transcript_88102/g.235727  ORF Transcript_88102/g.235727 Transcript_88102/m.235727 type:complete len:361 (+) Transcript_88102:218-1300(+)
MPRSVARSLGGLLCSRRLPVRRCCIVSGIWWARFTSLFLRFSLAAFSSRLLVCTCVIPRVVRDLPRRLLSRRRQVALFQRFGRQRLAQGIGDESHALDAVVRRHRHLGKSSPHQLLKCTGELLEENPNAVGKSVHVHRQTLVREQEAVRMGLPSFSGRQEMMEILIVELIGPISRSKQGHELSGLQPRLLQSGPKRLALQPHPLPALRRRRSPRFPGALRRHRHSLARQSALSPRDPSHRRAPEHLQRQGACHAPHVCVADPAVEAVAEGVDDLGGPPEGGGGRGAGLDVRATGLAGGLHRPLQQRPGAALRADPSLQRHPQPGVHLHPHGFPQAEVQQPAQRHPEIVHEPAVVLGVLVN